MAKDNTADFPPEAEDRVYTQQESAQAASELRAYKALEGRSSKRKRAGRLRVIIGVTVGVTILGVVAMLLKNALNPPLPALPQPSDVVQRSDFVDSISATGNLAAYEQVTITPEVDGTVAELFVAEGDSVQAGQLLFTLENPDLDRAITMAQRGLDSANINLRSVQSMRTDAGRAADNAWVVYSDTKWAYELSLTLAPDDPWLTEAPTQADVDRAYEAYRQSLSAVESAKLSVESAQMGVSDAQLSLDQAIAMAEKRKVYTPISGLVVLNNIERGTKLSTLASTGKVPMQVADVSRMRMTISINEIDILGIRPGMQALVSVDALEGYVTDAEVLRVASTSGSGEDVMYYGGGGGLVYYQVDLLIKEPDPRLKIGMSANAQIIFLKLEDVLLVNSMAIQSDGPRSFVLVMEEDGSNREVDVVIIASSSSITVVEGDLEAGDQVLLTIGYNGGQSPGGGVIRPGGAVIVD
jgi:HlyD family secretion protein